MRPVLANHRPWQIPGWIDAPHARSAPGGDVANESHSQQQPNEFAWPRELGWGTAPH